MDSNKSNSLFKSSLTAGLVTGLILIIYSLILYFIGLNLNQLMGYISLLILAICIYVFSILYRDKEFGGTISYADALGFGVLVGVFATILSAIFNFIEIKYLDPSIIVKQLDLAQQKIAAKGLSEDQIEKQWK